MRQCETTGAGRIAKMLKANATKVGRNGRKSKWTIWLGGGKAHSPMNTSSTGYDNENGIGD